MFDSKGEKKKEKKRKKKSEVNMNIGHPPYQHIEPTRRSYA
jgi:hypothetical protein